MIRLYAINLWPLMHREGYQYVMRMDEDSFLRSDIPYNLFEYLRQRDIDYAYRLASWESGYRKRPGSYGFHGVLRDYITRFQVSPVWLFDPCPIGTTAATYTFERCGHLYGIYNNFFVARVGFFLRHDVQAFLQHADKWHSIYVFRYNDILWQSAAIQMFLERRRVHMFTDWAYEHATFMGTESYGHRGVKCLWFGGLVLGTGAAAVDQSEAIERFWHLARMPPCRGASKAMRPCLSLGAASNSSTQRGSESLTRRPLQSILMGTVSREMPFCAASAAPMTRTFAVGVSTTARCSMFCSANGCGSRTSASANANAARRPCRRHRVQPSGHATMITSVSRLLAVSWTRGLVSVAWVVLGTTRVKFEANLA